MPERVSLEGNDDGISAPNYSRKVDRCTIHTEGEDIDEESSRSCDLSCLLGSLLGDVDERVSVLISLVSIRDV